MCIFGLQTLCAENTANLGAGVLNIKKNAHKEPFSRGANSKHHKGINQTQLGPLSMLRDPLVFLLNCKNNRISPVVLKRLCQILDLSSTALHILDYVEEHKEG